MSGRMIVFDAALFSIYKVHECVLTLTPPLYSCSVASLYALNEKNARGAVASAELNDDDNHQYCFMGNCPEVLVHHSSTKSSISTWHHNH